VSSPGWYPDPSGQPNSFRYWDGQAWSQQTTDNPYSPPPGAWQQPPQQGYAGDPGATQLAPQQPAEQSPTSDEPQQWGGQEPTPTTPELPQQWGADPQQQWGSTAGAAGAAGAAGWPSDTGQQQWGDQQGGQQWGDATSQFAATGAAGGSGGYGGDQWSGGGGQQWGPMPGDGGGDSGGSKKALWIVLAGVLAILLILGGIFGAMALTGDDDDDNDGSDDTPSQTTDPGDDASESPSDEPSDAPSDDPSDAPSTDTVPTDEPDDVPTAPVADFCTSGEPTDRELHPEDGNLYGGGLASPQIQGYTLPPGPIGEVYTFADDVATLYREVQPGKWMSVLALGALEKEDAGSDLEAAATAVMECMANSSDFYLNMSDTQELASEATQVDGHDAWRVRWEIRVADPEVDAGGDVAEVVVVDTGDDDYGLFAGVVPLNDQKLIKRLGAAVSGLTVE